MAKNGQPKIDLQGQKIMLERCDFLRTPPTQRGVTNLDTQPLSNTSPPPPQDMPDLEDLWNETPATPPPSHNSQVVKNKNDWLWNVVPGVIGLIACAFLFGKRFIPASSSSVLNLVPSSSV